MMLRGRRRPRSIPFPYTTLFRSLSDLELASKLSFFLWNTIPDDELLQLAIDGKLKDLTVLDRQVKRMLADPRSITLAAKDRKSTRLNSSHGYTSYAVFCLKQTSC